MLTTIRHNLITLLLIPVAIIAWLIFPPTLAAQTYSESGVPYSPRSTHSTTVPKIDRIPTTLSVYRIISHIRFDNTSARQALNNIAVRAQLNLMVHWTILENAGIDPDTPITLNLTNVSAYRIMKYIVAELEGDNELITEITSSYIRITTKEHANKQTVVKVYTIDDLVLVVPDFHAPSFDISNTSEGGEDFSFDNNTEDDNNQILTSTDIGNNIADVIRNSIEPEIWEANGGIYGRITYHRGRLIIRAPQYVHKQIGLSDSERREQRQRTAHKYQHQYGTMTSSTPATNTPYIPQYARPANPSYPYTPASPYKVNRFTSRPAGIDWNTSTRKIRYYTPP